MKSRASGAAFSTRRKTVLNALGNGLGLPRETLEAGLQGCGIDPGLRAEVLPTEAFRRLAEALRPGATSSR